MTELTPPTNSSIGPFDEVGDVLGPTFRLFGDSLWLITKLTVVIVAPLEILKVLSAPELEHDWQLQVGTYLLQLLSNVLIAPALIFALMTAMQTGFAPGINESYGWGAGRLPKLLVCASMAGVLQTLGYFLCFIPGILIAIALSLVYPIAVLENRSPIDVLGESNRLTKGHRLKILFAAIPIIIIVFVMNAATEVLAQGSFPLWLLPLVAIAADIVGQAPTVLSLVIYLGIRRTLEAGQAQY